MTGLWIMEANLEENSGHMKGKNYVQRCYFDLLFLICGTWVQLLKK